MSELRLEAASKSGGMSMDEVIACFHSARKAGFMRLKKTRVGFKGQIIELHFDNQDTRDHMASGDLPEHV